ncbi:glycosyltransferase family 4 protein [Paraburkholderia tagetis]|uniref:Glycosyltransferase family 4 protein n=1 Tax=Paraburkholderia tagetis TaxID=2913261 RepID=A0A9X1RQL9_9BURK|nr:glycosyltransferase family 1 protein [Paraburkholderia tagetis]MCG5075613.1 glycosyltransferase family 4 protein [Paraburkholderia tagetis]
MSETFTAGAPLEIAMGGRALLTPLTGIGQYASHLAREFVQRGHSLRLFYGTHWSSTIAGGSAEGMTAAGAPVAGASMRTSFAGALKRFARTHVPGVYRFMPHVEQYRFDSGLRRQRKPHVYHDPNFIPFRFRGPTVTTVHDVSWVRHPDCHPEHRLAHLRANFPRALRHADRVIVVSEFVKRELMECFPVDASKIDVVYNGVTERFRPHTRAETARVLARYKLAHKGYFAAVGTLEPRKNLQTALAAHLCLPLAVRRAMPLALIGVEGWLTESLHTALAASLADGTVRKLGYVSDDDIPVLTAGARAIVYPSIYEGFGLPVLEAMASGVPALCSTAPALREVAGPAALFCEPADVDGFTQAMRELIEDDALCARLGDAGAQRAREFSWSRTATETLAVYRKVAD